MDNYFSILLNAHLPYVYHPEHPSFLEENWFFEAISETYIPLLQLFQRLENDNIPCRLAISISSTLLAMLDYPELQVRYLEYLERQSALCKTLMQNWQCLEAERQVLDDYLKFYQKSALLFEKQYQCNLIPAFRQYRDKGMLDLLCTSATHAFLPNFQEYPKLIRQQLRLAIATFEKHFGNQESLGIWLPECGYYDGLDKLLLKEGIRYCYITLHGMLGNSQLPKYGSFAPIQSPEGLILFPREQASSAIIWDQHIGYPGAKAYRDFYQDVGYKADLEVLSPYLPFGNLRYYTGIKLWRIEQQHDSKSNVCNSPYEKDKALTLTKQHSLNFLQHLWDHSQKASLLMNKQTLISTVYDAELFGHWWHEGPHFLEQLFRSNHEQQKTDKISLKFITPSEYLQKEYCFQTLNPCFSSWGRDGYAQVWLDQKNDWIYSQLFELYESIEVILDYKSKLNQQENRNNQNEEYGFCLQQAIKQLIREFCLACASDWAFMIKSDTNKDYATTRTSEHIKNTLTILQGLARRKLDNHWLKQLQEKHRIFTDIDIENFWL